MIHLRNGTYGHIEIKLGGDKLIEEGAETLKDLASKVDTKKYIQTIIYDGVMCQSTFCL